MIFKRTPVALALASALVSAGAGAAAFSHGPLSHTGAVQHISSAASSNPVVGADGMANVMIVLKGDPATHAYTQTLRSTGGGAVGQTAANNAARNAISALQSAQSSFATQLRSSGVAYTELYRVQRVLNGIAVRMKPADMDKIRAMPNVEHVVFLPVYERPSNIASVPFVTAPGVWAGGTLGALPFNATGKGVKIGDIDTGLDFVHPDFGGTGALADYQDVDPKSVIGKNSHNIIFPTAKVVGGTDFAGDAYNGANAPVPDPNPMDCGGHGSHTAGTLAGVGVNADGSPFAGVYNATAPYTNNLKIGPGVAPQASLYALRVFGCGGNTSLVTQAIDWATDPNGNGDLSDHLDVINMSLGSATGIDSASYDTDIEAVNAAVAAGVIVVSAAGNSGDTFFINGAPGAANLGISAAASVDNGQTITQLHVSSPTPAADYAAQASGFANPNGVAPPAPGGQSANIVLALDTTGGKSLGCGQFPTVFPDPNAFSNAGAISGNFALIDRGTCSFYVKVLNAQAAGAAGVIVDNSLANAPLVFMGNTGTTLPTPITIPSLFISKENGTTIKGELTGTVASTFNAVLQPQLADTLAGFSSRGPVTNGNGVTELKPDIAAPGLNIPSAQTGFTCDNSTTHGCITPSTTGFIPGGQALTISGTSMATPHIAGLMALLRQLNPSASVEDLKAMAMNSASHDVSSGPSGTPPLYGASRVGAGRIDATAAATGSVLAYNADVPGAVAVTFDVEPVGGSFQASHTVTLANRTGTAQQVTLALDTILDSPGISFSVPNSQITIPANGTTTFTVTLNADTSQMVRYIDPTMALTQSSVALNGSFPRQYVAEESAVLKVLDGSSHELARLPVYAANRPHSSLTTAADLGPAAPATGTTNLTLTGQDVCTGTVSTGGSGLTCSATLATGEESLVSPFELQLTAASNPNVPAWGSLHYVGINSTPNNVSNPVSSDFLFGISTYGKWGSQRDMSFNVCVDTDGDGKFDKIVNNTDLGSLDALFGLGGAGPEDTFFSTVYDNVTGNVFVETPVNLQDASQADTGAMINNSMILYAFGADLGVAQGATIHYGVAVCPGFSTLCGSADWTPPTFNPDGSLKTPGVGTAHCGISGNALESFNGPIAYNASAPGVDGNGNALFEDLNGGTLAVSYNVNNLAANGSSGMLLLHTHNTAATSAQTVVLDRIFADGFGN